MEKSKQYAIRDTSGQYYISGLAYYQMTSSIAKSQLYPTLSMALTKAKTVKKWLEKKGLNSKLEIVPVDIIAEIDLKHRKMSL